MLGIRLVGYKLAMTSSTRRQNCCGAVRKNQWPQQLKDSRSGKLMIWNLGWLAGDPDADTFYQILYGISKGQANHSRFDLPQ